MILRQGLTAVLLASVLALPACGGPRPVRGEDVEGFDDEAMSTGLDKRDLQRLLHLNMKALQGSKVLARWEKEDSPRVAVVPLRNETSEHVDSALASLTSDIESILIETGHVRVISLERQTEMIEEVRRQHSDAFDPSTVARWGKQAGVRYLVTGKVFSSDERHRDERRVQYFLFLQILDAETSDVLFQNKSEVTKGLAR